MKKSKSDGKKKSSTANTPAPAPRLKSPPRSTPPGRLLLRDPGPPKQLASSPKLDGQVVQPSAKSPHSATHSDTFPTMSNAPQLDLQLDREPVFTASPTEKTLQSVVPLSASPGSGVPCAAACHSSFRASRLPESRHAWFAWNQVMHALGSTPGMETA